MSDEYDDDEYDVPEPPTKVIIPYAPRPWQLEMHRSLKRFNVLVVHRGAGKSVFATNQLLLWSTSAPPFAEFAYILPLRNQAQRNVWPAFKRLVEVIPGVRFNNATLEITLPAGQKIMILGADDPEKLRGLHLHGVVLDEYGDMHANIWRAVRPMLTNHRGKVIWIGTPKGRNAFWDVYQRSLEPDRPDWMGVLLDWKATNALTAEEVAQMESEMTADEFAQEMLCSFDASNKGAYYARQISDLRESGAINATGLYRDDLEVHVSFDLGFRDKTALWWFQVVIDPLTRKETIHFLDFEQESGLGLRDWAEIIRHREKLYGYRRGSIIMPHDVKQHDPGSGISRLETAEQVGLFPELCPKQDVMDGIELCRRHLPRCKFDPKCAEGVDALGQYKAKMDKMGNGLRPDHDHNSHASDSFRYAITYIVEVFNAPSLMRMPVFRRR